MPVVLERRQPACPSTLEPAGRWGQATWAKGNHCGEFSDAPFEQPWGYEPTWAKLEHMSSVVGKITGGRKSRGTPRRCSCRDISIGVPLEAIGPKCADLPTSKAAALEASGLDRTGRTPEPPSAF
jgi:hypothetical protein